MASYSTNEFKQGLKVMLEGDPCSILSNEFVKPGKSQPFNRVKLRNLLNGRVIERTFKSGDTLEAADVAEGEMQYLYNDGLHWHFMHPETYEQYVIDKAVIEEAAVWFKEQMMCTVTLWNGRAITVLPPKQVVLEVTATEPGFKGDTVVGGSKPATLSTGVVVRVPLFVNEGDLIRVDTRTGEYLSRAKE